MRGQMNCTDRGIGFSGLVPVVDLRTGLLPTRALNSVTALGGENLGAILSGGNGAAASSGEVLRETPVDSGLFRLWSERHPWELLAAGLMGARDDSPERGGAASSGGGTDAVPVLEMVRQIAVQEGRVELERAGDLMTVKMGAVTVARLSDWYRVLICAYVRRCLGSDPQRLANANSHRFRIIFGRGEAASLPGPRPEAEALVRFIQKEPRSAHDLLVGLSHANRRESGTSRLEKYAALAEGLADIQALLVSRNAAVSRPEGVAAIDPSPVSVSARQAVEVVAWSGALGESLMSPMWKHDGDRVNETTGPRIHGRIDQMARVMRQRGYSQGEVEAFGKKLVELAWRHVPTLWRGKSALTFLGWVCELEELQGDMMDSDLVGREGLKGVATLSLYRVLDKMRRHGSVGSNFYFVSFGRDFIDLASSLAPSPADGRALAEQHRGGEMQELMGMALLRGLFDNALLKRDGETLPLLVRQAFVRYLALTLIENGAWPIFYGQFSSFLSEQKIWWGSIWLGWGRANLSRFYEGLLGAPLDTIFEDLSRATVHDILVASLPEVRRLLSVPDDEVNHDSLLQVERALRAHLTEQSRLVCGSG